MKENIYADFVCNMKERAKVHPRVSFVAKLLIGDRIAPKRVAILDSIRSQNYRGRLSSDEAFAFKLETAAERKIGVDEKFLKGLEYYPSGSVVDGLSAALLGRCQILKIERSFMRFLARI
ncbi:hypothetical protein K1719_043442 [Acacia pycnantha]|nr:hypothetical protein K1719_043442 [Acacia pycnantha]